jgi:valyl-tRNA synthetase
MNVPVSARIPLLLKDASETARGRLFSHHDLIVALARLSCAEVLDEEAAAGAISDVIDGATIVLPIADVIDVSVEKARLAREIARLEAEISRVDGKLANTTFLAKAPPEVIETERERQQEAMQARAKLDEAARRLSAL